jgi:nucleotide-binding universal stress UspA family protein
VAGFLAAVQVIGSVGLESRFDQGREKMKILLATDGSPCSEAVVREACHRPWPADSEVKVVSVAQASPFIAEPAFEGPAVHFESLLQGERERAAEKVAGAAREIGEKAPGLRISTEVLEGWPKEVIIEEAERWEADLILVGSHGHGPVTRFLLGSVSHAVALYAPCSVEIVRCRELPAAVHES